VRILVVEDDRRLGDLLLRGLSEIGHVVDVESDGVRGETLAKHGTYDAVILDVMLPSKNGFAVTRALRDADVRTPILILTARDTTGDIVGGLDAGADDYLRKPFVFQELEARLRSIARREPAAVRTELRCDDLTMDLGTRRVSRGGREIVLTARELAFLEFFMRNERLLITREMLEDALWERGRDTASNVIEVYIRRLRAKLGGEGERALIHTVRGSGYRFGPLAG
jgi:two-component system copper resistance phosphate regulon response regulator CusR